MAQFRACIKEKLAIFIWQAFLLISAARTVKLVKSYRIELWFNMSSTRRAFVALDTLSSENYL